MSSSGVPAIPASWPLVGRDAELALAAQALSKVRLRGLVIAGLPGVGKTRLARSRAALPGPVPHPRQRPFHTGRRRSANALAPSSWSCEP
jgi:MoxR-like ATPase